MQLAKLAGNKVIATCGGTDKAKLLKDLGVDRVIDYKAENIKSVRFYKIISLLIFMMYESLKKQQISIGFCFIRSGSNYRRMTSYLLFAFISW